MPQTGQGVDARKAQIPAAIETLHHRCEQLSESISRMAERIPWAMRPEPPVRGPEGLNKATVDSGSMAPLAEEINNVSGRIQSSIAEIQSLTERIEL